MKEVQHLAILSLLLLLIACKSQEQGNNSEQAEHDHSQHQHDSLEITNFAADAPIPTLKLDVKPDPTGGWNVHIATEHFIFTPENTNQDPRAGEGHAHIFVDNYKFARVYAPWYHLKTLTPGKHHIRVTLNANDHSNWSHKGKEISTTVTIEQD